MKTTMSWRGNKAMHKKKRVKNKPKIRWQQLGFKSPAAADASIPMDEIRRQVVMLSSRGLGQGVRSRAMATSRLSDGAINEAGPAPKQRRGATE